MSTSAQPVFEPVELPSKYSKAIVGLLTMVLGVAVVAFEDNHVSRVELVNILIYFLTAIGIYFIPLFPSRVGRYSKMLIAFLGTGLQALVPFLLTGNVTTVQWLLVSVAALGSVGVGIVPNVKTRKEVAAEDVDVVTTPVLLPTDKIDI